MTEKGVIAIGHLCQSVPSQPHESGYDEQRDRETNIGVDYDVAFLNPIANERRAG